MSYVLLGAGSAPVVQRVRWDARSSANPAAPHPRDQPPSACPMGSPGHQANADAPHPRDRPPSACPMGPKIIGYLEANTGSQLPHRLARWEAQTAKLTRTLRTATPEVPRNLPSELPIGQADGERRCAAARSVADGLFPYRTVCTTSFGSGAAFKCCVFKRFGSGVAWFVLGLTAITSRLASVGLVPAGAKTGRYPRRSESQPFFPRPPRSGGRGKKGRGGVGRFGGSGQAPPPSGQARRRAKGSGAGPGKVK